MQASGLRNLLCGIIDYAGMFPPANLPLEEAIGNYARYRREAESWLLGRFICPVQRLPDLSAFMAELFTDGPALAVSALGRGGEDRHSMLAGLEADLQVIRAFRLRHGSRATVQVFETRLPAEAAAVQGGMVVVAGDLLDAALQMISAAELAAFFEAAPTADDAGRWGIIRALAQRRDPGSGGPGGVGFKLRCGGLEASAFPSTRQVALVLRAARDAVLPLKFTAGLHHPIRRPDPPTGAAMHGFLNIFIAAVLAYARRLTEDQILQILEDEQPGNFRFDADGLAWKDLRADGREIADARRLFAVSFGSCSFDEPRDDLRGLGLL